jgi:hypothetical protein
MSRRRRHEAGPVSTTIGRGERDLGLGPSDDAARGGARSALQMPAPAGRFKLDTGRESTDEEREGDAA